MSLIVNTLFGQVDKVERSIQRIREYIPMMKKRGVVTNGAFSGGKDSVVIKELTRMAFEGTSEHIPWFYNQVGIDPPELVQYIKDFHPEVTRIIPPKPFFTRMIEKRFPPMRWARWCCEQLKEYRGEGMIIIGIRAAESSKRAKRLMFEPCKTDRKRFFLSPIMDWLDEDVWEFIKTRNLSYCKLYDEGFHRLGCIFCPMAPASQIKKQAERWPKFRNAFISGFRKLMKFRIERGLPVDNWDDAEAMFEWWILRGKRAKDKLHEDQQCFKFDN